MKYTIFDKLMFILIIILLICSLWHQAGKSDELSWLMADSRYKLIELNELTIDYKNFGILSDHQRDLLIYPNAPKEGIDVGMKIDLIGVGYLDSIIESMTDSSQYAGIGLQLRLGIRPVQGLEIGLYHHSQHALDTQIKTIDKFPSENAIELKFYLYQKGNRGSIF